MIRVEIALRKEIFKQLGEESAILLVIFTAMVIVFKSIFISENFLVVVRTVIAIFWIIILPGFSAMFYWREELKFYERLVIGIGIGVVVLGLSSYYLGILGLHIKYHTLLLPSVIIIAGLGAAMMRKASS